MFNAFEELFSPGRKHTSDEQNRLELTREDVGDADPGRGPIDLTSGKVVVRPPKPTADEDATDTPTDTTDTPTDATDADDAEAAGDSVDGERPRQ
ncbi:DUF6191 domain-containing protein [Streptomyces sp. NPDC014995]|uniref:DUF6191 domain-containing protein n=1 Tax=Streptomyces sp. NPDC014995 TaxID=3364936 RepID=UPI003700AACE